MSLVSATATQSKIICKPAPRPRLSAIAYYYYRHLLAVRAAGHVKAALLNYYYAKEKYKGKMILRFDDTNPNNEKGEYVEMIQKDLLRLGVKPDKLTHTSDSFDRIAAFARYGKSVVMVLP